MSRQSVCVCALLMFASLVLAACGSQAPAAPAEIRIGLITTLTGELAESTGKETIDAVKLAIQPLNDAGGLLVGGRKLKVTLVIEDDQDKAELATSTAQKLINQDQVVALIGSSISRNAIPTADVAERARPHDQPQFYQSDDHSGQAVCLPSGLHRPIPGAGASALRPCRPKRHEGGGTLRCRERL